MSGSTAGASDRLLVVPDHHPVLHDPVDGGQPGRLLLRPQGELRDQGDLQPNGMYHRWGWRGLVADWAGFAVMVPFMSTSPDLMPLAGCLHAAQHAARPGG